MKKQSIILLSDFIEQRLRKQKELEYYEEELKKLQEKAYWLRRDIDLTNTIIDIIQQEKVVDIREEMNKKAIEDKS